MSVMTNTSSVRARREAALQQADIAAGFYNLLDGQRLAAAQTLDVTDPASGKALAKVPDVDRSDPDAAVDAAARSFPSWSRPPRDVRKAAAGRVIETLGEHADELATLLAAEGRSMGVAQWEIKWITDLYGSALPSIDLTEERWVQERVGQVVKRYVPLGVDCAISPWNLPFMLFTADGANSSVDAMSQFSRPLRQPGSLSLGVMPYAVDPEAGDRLWSLSERTSGPSPSPGLPRINTVAVVA